MTSKDNLSRPDVGFKSSFDMAKKKPKEPTPVPEKGRARDGLTPSDISRRYDETLRKMEEDKQPKITFVPPKVVVNPDAKPAGTGPSHPDGSGSEAKD